MKIWGFGILAVAMALALGACQGGEESAAPAEAAAKVEAFGDLDSVKVESLLPTKEGTQATYEAVGNNEEKVELTIRVGKVTESGSSKLVTLEFLQKNEVVDVTDWRIGPDGVFQLSARSGDKFNPEKLEIPADLNDREEKKYNGTGPLPSVDPGSATTGKIEGLTAIRGLETVDTSMGQIEALAVAGAVKYRSGDKEWVQRTTTWYSPKYGIVRYVQTLTRSDGLERKSGLKIKGFSAK